MAGPVRLFLEDGSYLLQENGSDKLLLEESRRQHTFGVDPGKYLLDGVGVALRANHQISLEVSAYVIDGQELGFRVVRTLFTEPAVYALVGGEGQVLWNRTLIPATDNYEILGIDPFLQRRRSEIGWDTALQPSICGGRAPLSVAIHPFQPQELVVFTGALHPPVDGERTKLSNAVHPRGAVSQALPLESCR